MQQQRRQQQQQEAQQQLSTCFLSEEKITSTALANPQGLPSLSSLRAPPSYSPTCTTQEERYGVYRQLLLLSVYLCLPLLYTHIYIYILYTKIYIYICIAFLYYLICSSLFSLSPISRLSLSLSSLSLSLSLVSAILSLFISLSSFVCLPLSFFAFLRFLSLFCFLFLLTF